MLSGFFFCTVVGFQSLPIAWQAIEQPVRQVFAHIAKALAVHLPIDSAHGVRVRLGEVGDLVYVPFLSELRNRGRRVLAGLTVALQRGLGRVLQVQVAKVLSNLPVLPSEVVQPHHVTALGIREARVEHLSNEPPSNWWTPLLGSGKGLEGV